ncbi:helix-turn-helix transcriptional regulator [Microbacterium trichothecenolyticum]|uniref:winged helix-turn-helix transcriptional regulator n=1 Tax=Microbacterium trichothecenolyticum TaxID=69370 RepID=UPI001C6E9C7D|nr:helix-turn-helix domain-containing protein [Microbacterium trichothecenolyticum]MBW9121437.1 helix-turn-helix transcriptional regulator [Microbacterium trichothecenolyticum]
MLGKTYDTQVCSIARSLEMVGERWSLLIIRDALFARVTRFGDFQHNLGIATNVLTSRLESFVAAGIMERAGAADYVLTPKGRALAVSLIALTEWGDEWASPVDPPILYRHSVCDNAVHATTTCDACGAVPADEVAVKIGPGMPAEYLAARRGGFRASS